MQPDKVELNRPTRRDFLRILAGTVAGVALSCAPKVPESLIRGATATSTPPPESPTSESTITAVEPTATPKPAEPTATPKPPEPTRAPELPRILRETPVYGIYSGDLFVFEGGRKVKKGGVILSHLPNNSFLVAYTILEPGLGGQRRGPALVAPRNSIAGAGFMIDDITTQTTPSLMSPEAIGGSLTAKELKDASGATIFPAMNGLSIDTRLESGVPSKDGLINAYIRLHQEFGTNLTKEQAQAQIEMVYRGPLPEDAGK